MSSVLLLPVVMIFLAMPLPPRELVAPVTATTPLTLETGPDNGFLPCAEHVLNPLLRNQTTDVAFTNLDSVASTATESVMIGHGDTGSLCTGDGNQCGATAGTIMGDFNETRPGDRWDMAAGAERDKFASLVMYSCDTGANNEGADFLFALAKRINRRACAPTYLVWCGDGKIFLDERAKWQCAKPSGRPRKIDKPTTGFPVPSVYKIKNGSAIVSYRRVQIVVLSFTYAAGRGQRTFRSVTASERRVLADEINFAAPFFPGAVPSAMISAEITLRVNDTPTTHFDRTFVIYNDDVAQDAAYPEVFYPVGSDAGAALRKMRRSRR